MWKVYKKLKACNFTNEIMQKLSKWLNIMVLNYSNTHETLTLMSGIVTFSIISPLAYKCGPTTVF